MGDIADMMIDGDLCMDCGVFMVGAGGGFPRRCRDCVRAARTSPAPLAAPKNAAKVACKECGRQVKAIGLDQHMRDKHGGAKPLTQQLNELDHEEQP